MRSGNIGSLAHGMSVGSKEEMFLQHSTATEDNTMTGTSGSRLRRTANGWRGTTMAGALLGAGVAVMTGCATGGEDNWNSTAVGDDKSVGELDLRSVLLVTDEEGSPGRLLGTFENNGDQAIDLEISDDDEDVTVTVPAQASVGLDTLETLLETTGDAPGARTRLTATTAAGTVELLVPVVDGTLDPYEPYLPG